MERIPRTIIVLGIIAAMIAGYNIRLWLNAGAHWVWGVATAPIRWVNAMRALEEIVEEAEKRRVENLNLRAAVRLAGKQDDRDETRWSRVRVYAQYPFANKHTITIAAGTAQGIAVGTVVRAAPEIFLGTVTKAGAGWSEVATIFDGNSEFAVRIGERGIAALLRGGIEPRLTMVDKEKPIREHDMVYTASKGLPYGLLIGEVGNIQKESVGAFHEASVTAGYVLGDLEDVLVETK